jgi:hypothetical protein
MLSALLQLKSALGIPMGPRYATGLAYAWPGQIKRMSHDLGSCFQLSRDGKLSGGLVRELLSGPIAAGC